MRRLVRRLRTDDQAALESLCRGDSLWSAYYRDHASWLNRALAEVKEAGRAVFGAFSPTLNKEGYSARLDTCIFLKLSSYEDSAELKNLVVRREAPEGEPELASFEDLARPLIEKAIRYCEVREIGKLEIELPQKEYTIVSLFMQLGFRIAALRERYIPGQYVCSLEKTIGERYNADPFDLVKLGNWLLRAILPCKVGPISTHEDIPYVPFEVYPSHPAFSPENTKGYAKRLRGTLTILDEGDCDEENVERLLGDNVFGDGQLRYVLAYELTESTRAMLTESGITPFDLEEVREIAGGARSSLSIPMHRSEVGGMLTVLESELVADYARFKRSFVYYLLSGIGSALDGSNEAGSLLAVFCPSWSDGKSGIIALAEIEEITDAPFDEAFNCYPDIPKALTKEDLAFYRTRSDKDRLPVLKCSRLQTFVAPLDVGDSSWVVSAEERAYLKQELEETNSIYISQQVCDSLRNYSLQFGLKDELAVGVEREGGQARRTRKGSVRRDVFICHAGEDKEVVVRPLLEKLTKGGFTAWFDEAEVRWGDSLTGKVNEGLRISRFVVVVLSPAFLAKKKDWPERELNAALNVEASKGQVKVLPILVGTDSERAAILDRYPLLSDKAYLVWDGTGANALEALRKRLSRERGAPGAPRNGARASGPSEKGPG